CSWKTGGWSRTRTLSSVRSGRYRLGRRIACSAATKAAERPGQSSHRFSTPANSTESILRPIWPTFSNAWCRARRRTIGCMNCSSGTGNRRARPRRRRRDSRKEAQGGKGDQAGQDDGRLRHVVRPARSLDGGTRQIDFPSPSPGDFPFDARRRRGRRRGGASLDESRRVDSQWRGLSTPPCGRDAWRDIPTVVGSHAPVLDAEPVRPGRAASGRPALSKGILMPLTFDPLTDQRELLRHYTLTETDIAMIRRCRGDHSRLGYALMLCYLRYPGRPLRIGERPPAALVSF